MNAFDPSLFSITRPALDRYRAVSQRRLAVETYHSSAGHMLSKGALHRISINRTAHQRYAYREAGSAMRRVARPAFTLGFQPADRALEVDGDAADYISIFQDPVLYEEAGSSFRLAECDAQELSAAADPATLHVAFALAEMSKDGPDVDMLLLEHLALGLARCVARLLDRGRSAPPAPPSGSLGQKQLKRVIDYVESCLGKQSLSVEELAGIAHLSPFHFSRSFKLATGLAPHRYVLEQRVRRAQLYLSEGGETLASISYVTGFSSQAHFSNIFRRVTGVTPREYRQSLRS